MMIPVQPGAPSAATGGAGEGEATRSTTVLRRLRAPALPVLVGLCLALAFLLRPGLWPAHIGAAGMGGGEAMLEAPLWSGSFFTFFYPSWSTAFISFYDVQT